MGVIPLRLGEDDEKMLKMISIYLALLIINKQNKLPEIKRLYKPSDNVENSLKLLTIIEDNKLILSVLIADGSSFSRAIHLIRVSIDSLINSLKREDRGLSLCLGKIKRLIGNDKQFCVIRNYNILNAISNNQDINGNTLLYSIISLREVIESRSL
jgi:hypothetical protein